MAYDLHGSWDPVTGHNAGLHPAHSGDTLNVVGPSAVFIRYDNLSHQRSAVEYYLTNRFPPQKLVLGIGLYGRSWTLADSSRNGVGAPAVGPGTPRPFSGEAGYAAYYEVSFISLCRRLYIE